MIDERMDSNKVVEGTKLIRIMLLAFSGGFEIHKAKGVALTDFNSPVFIVKWDTNTFANNKELWYSNEDSSPTIRYGYARLEDEDFLLKIMKRKMVNDLIAEKNVDWSTVHALGDTFQSLFLTWIYNKQEKERLARQRLARKKRLTKSS